MKFESIGKNIRRFRKERGYRQEDLAEMVGLSVNYMGAIERGEKLPSLETFITIVNCLGASADFILADVLAEGYRVKESLLSEKLSGLRCGGCFTENFLKRHSYIKSKREAPFILADEESFPSNFRNKGNKQKVKWIESGQSSEPFFSDIKLLIKFKINCCSC